MIKPAELNILAFFIVNKKIRTAYLLDEHFLLFRLRTFNALLIAVGVQIFIDQLHYRVLIHNLGLESRPV